MSSLEEYQAERIQALEKRLQEQQDRIDSLHDKHFNALAEIMEAYLAEKEPVVVLPSRWKIGFRQGGDTRIHASYVNATDKESAIACWLKTACAGTCTDDIVTVRRVDTIRPR